MKRAVILVNAYTRSSSELHQPRRLKEELEKLGVRTEILRNDFAPAYLDGNGVACALSCDFCIYLDKDRYASRLLEAAGIRLFNRAAAVEVCDDKFNTFLALSEKVPMPATVPAPLCYTQGESVSAALLDRAERALGYPVVVKECYGSLGKGVFLARSRGELETLAQRLQFRPHLFQRFISESAGRDLRAVVIGGEPVACMVRESRGDFRSNAELGGVGKKYTPDGETVKMLKQISDLLGLDYCGIDLLFSVEGMLLCEVNSNAFFRVAEEVTGVNIAREYALYIYDQVYGGGALCYSRSGN